jgi:hypothetical protein
MPVIAAERMLRSSVDDVTKTIDATKSFWKLDGTEASFRELVLMDVFEENPLIGCPEEDGVVQLLMREQCLEPFVEDPLLLLRQLEELIPTRFDQWIAKNRRPATEWLVIRWTGSFEVFFRPHLSTTLYREWLTWYELEQARVQYWFSGYTYTATDQLLQADMLMLANQPIRGVSVARIAKLPCWDCLEPNILKSFPDYATMRANTGGATFSAGKQSTMMKNILKYHSEYIHKEFAGTNAAVKVEWDAVMYMTIHVAPDLMIPSNLNYSGEKDTLTSLWCKRAWIQRLQIETYLIDPPKSRQASPLDVSAMDWYYPSSDCWLSPVPTPELTSVWTSMMQQWQENYWPDAAIAKHMKKIATVKSV